MRLALYQSDIPQNAGALIRLAACKALPVDIIEPCGFVFSDSAFRRAGMDYLESAQITRHVSFERFLETIGSERLVLLTAKGATLYTEFAFRFGDVLLLGRESGGRAGSRA